MTEPAAGVLLDSCAADVVAAGLRELLARAPDARRVREIAERFSWDVATRGQLAIFRRLAGGGAAERGSIANSVNGAKGRVTR
jgi:hypothetical protein